VFYDNIYFHENILGTNDFKIADVKVYPNPTRDSWTVKTDSQELVSIELYDVLGKNVLTLSPNSRETIIDATGFKTGLYFAKIITAKGVTSIKLLKQ
jgi:hypothetical protein